MNIYSRHLTIKTMDIEQAYNEHKTAGNNAFKKADYVLAVEEYSKGIEILENENEETEIVENINKIEIINENLEDISKHSKKHAHALAILYSNRAQAQLKQENYGSAISDCTISLEHDNEFVKSLYRRAVANYAIRDLTAALKDCKTARSMTGGDDIKIKKLTNEISMELKKIKFEQAIEIVEKSIFTTIDWDNAQQEKGELIINRGENGDIEIVDGLNEDYISRMIKKFKETDEGGLINKMDAFAIINAANTLFKNERLLVEINFNRELKGVKELTICGDTHGQFYDVLNIFEKFGKVSDDHVYLFNGDFVDRGSWGCEVAFLLYSLKVLYPNKIFINRGNHETDDMNSVYGFRDECKYKYGDKIFKCFSESFSNLSYCTLINEEILVMHGGLFSDDSIGIKELRKLDYSRQVQGQPPKNGIEMELLWTDPQSENGRSLSKRGIGLQFGPDITKAFIERNNLKYIIRSHEVRQKGYEWEHYDKLCTVFSAPNYCDSQGNLGAVVRLLNEGNEIKCESFSAVPHPNIPPMKYTKNQFGF